MSDTRGPRLGHQKLPVEPSSCLAGSLSTGVLPTPTMCFGPGTDAHGFIGRIWKMQNQANSIRTAAKYCLTVGAEPLSRSMYAAATAGLRSASAKWRDSHQSKNRMTG